MLLAQALDVLVTVACQTNLDLIFAGLWKRMWDQGPAARADRQAFDVFLLGEVRADAERLAAGRAARVSYSESADPLSGSDIAIEQGRRQVAHGDIVEPMARLIFRQQRIGIDVDRQEVSDGVLIFGPRQTTERRGPAGIGFLDRRSVERSCEKCDYGVDFPSRRPHLLRRRHLASDELVYDVFPRLRIAAHIR